MSVVCPVHQSENCVKLYKTFDKNTIIKQYQETFQINVTKYFEGIENLSLYCCNYTGYCFFVPFTLKGDNDFYMQLSKMEHYYPDWKWEYDEALRQISPNDVVLEIACGNGHFLKAASKKARRVVGFDITTIPYNDENINIFSMDFDSFFKTNTELFDLVVAFQYLEHIDDVNHFFSVVSKVLKPKGKLILALPNSKLSFIKNEILNFPPHHLGWWTQRSLKKVAEYFNFNIHISKTEPLYPKYINRKLYNEELARIQRFGILGRIYNSLTHKIYLYLQKKLSSLFKGHSFLILMIKK